MTTERESNRKYVISLLDSILVTSNKALIFRMVAQAFFCKISVTEAKYNSTEI